MKKLIYLILTYFVVLSLNAQTKITKSSVVGKWSIYSIEMPGTVYYNVDKDSLEMGEAMKAQIKDEQQTTAVKNMFRQQMAVFIKTIFLFNADGTAELQNGAEPPEKDTYSVDEDNSTIITTGENKQKEARKAEMLGDKLCIRAAQPQGEIIMVLKKVK